jgi:hypothetical protein
MLGLQVKLWDFELDPPRTKSPRAGSSHARLISYMTSQPAGPVSLSDIQHDMRIGPSGLKKLRKTLNNKHHETTRALAAVEL